MCGGRDFPLPRCVSPTEMVHTRLDPERGRTCPSSALRLSDSKGLRSGHVSSFFLLCALVRLSQTFAARFNVTCAVHTMTPHLLTACLAFMLPRLHASEDPPQSSVLPSLWQGLNKCLVFTLNNQSQVNISGSSLSLYSKTSPRSKRVRSVWCVFTSDYTHNDK